MTISVLIADAQVLFADALAIALGRFDDLDPIDDLPSDAAGALEATGAFRPDVAVLDFWLEGIDAWALTRRVVARSPGTRILHLSWFHGANQIEESIASGAAGFLPKGLRVTDVAEAIRRADAGECPVFADRLDGLVNRIERKRRYVEARSEALAAITPRELELLHLISNGLPVEEIAARLGITRATVRTHIHNILDKAGARSQLEAVAIARDHGLLP